MTHEDKTYKMKQEKNNHDTLKFCLLLKCMKTSEWSWRVVHCDVVNGLKHAKTLIHGSFCWSLCCYRRHISFNRPWNILKKSVGLWCHHVTLMSRIRGFRRWGRSGSRWRCGWCCSGSWRCCCTWSPPVTPCLQPPGSGPPSRTWPGNLRMCRTSSGDLRCPSSASDTPGRRQQTQRRAKMSVVQCRSKWILQLVSKLD